MLNYKRPIFSNIYKNIQTPRKFIQLLSGPRQVGKTTLIQQLQQELNIPFLFVNADDPLHQNRAWLETQWKIARSQIDEKNPCAVLAVDEIQKIPQWSDIVKTFWDDDTLKNINLKVILLGSSALKLMKDSSESLAGRFEKTTLTQWSKTEMQDAFEFDFKTYAFFGGYPGAATLVEDEPRWKNYLKNSIIEPVLNIDILALHRVEKPALLRQVFQLACEYSGQILSLNKILGQLQNSGNIATISFYIELLSSAGLIKGLQKWTTEKVRTRASSPKLLVLDIGLMTAVLDYSKDDLEKNTEVKGRVIESLVGTHLLHQANDFNFDVYYWNEGHMEVDFIVKKGTKILAIEVKSGRKSRSLNGLNMFLKKHPTASRLLVGGEGVDLHLFLSKSVLEFM